CDCLNCPVGQRDSSENTRKQAFPDYSGLEKVLLQTRQVPRPVMGTAGTSPGNDGYLGCLLLPPVLLRRCIGRTRRENYSSQRCLLGRKVFRRAFPANTPAAGTTN